MLTQLLRALADQIVDTTRMNVHEGCADVIHREVRARTGTTSSNLTTCFRFGFRNGIPPASDMVFDVRFLPQPLLRSRAQTENPGHRPEGVAAWGAWRDADAGVPGRGWVPAAVL